VEMSVYLVLEVVIIEMADVNAARVLDEASGLNLLRILG